MKVLYIDGASGVSGDMLLGALVELGLDPDLLRSRLKQLPLKGYSIRSRKVKRAGIAARKIDVRTTGRHAHRGLKEIRSILKGSDLEDAVKKKALEIFGRIIEVEARVHRIPKEKVHLHEVGAVDAIVDIVGAVIGIHHVLGSGKLFCSPLNVGSGTVKMAHGLLPVPAPATAALLRKVPIYSAGPAGEMVTPTGAAIVTAFASSFGPPPAMSIDRIGYGAGDREYDHHPNVLRAMIGSTWPAADVSSAEVMVLECTIDDMNPQGYGYLMDRLFSAGAREVFYIPVQMKKTRPGILVTVISPTGLVSDLSRILFEETTTIGVRYRPASRLELVREIKTVATPFGRVRLKISSLEGRITQAQPEYEDCRRLAARRRVPLKEVQASALTAYRTRSE